MKFVTKVAAGLGLMVAVAGFVAPPAHAANTCNAFISISYNDTNNFHTIGDQLRVVLTLGTGGINGGTFATVNRVRFEMDCKGGFPLGLGCMDDGTVVKYLGDSTIMSDCGQPTRSFTTGHTAGPMPNQLVFTPDTPFNIPPTQPTFCSISFGVEIAGLSGDVTPGLAEEVAGYSAGSADMRCSNGLASAGSQSGSIPLCPSCNDNNNCTDDTCTRSTGACVNTPKDCNDNNLCTSDSCVQSSGACSNVPKDCNDNNACTMDSCDPATGNCVNTPKVCNDNDACTDDFCDASGTCQAPPKNCNDNNICTDDSCNANGECVHVFDASNDPSCVTTCSLSVDKKGCVAVPPTLPEPCTGGAVALTMKYTGPAIAGPTTVKVTGGSSSVTYNLPNLTPGTVLTSAAENGFTIDAKAHNQTKLGAQTTVTINGTSEILHTSCSCRDTPLTNLAVCNPMCLDGGSPDNPTPGTKGPGSPLWTLVAEVDPSLGLRTCQDSGSGSSTCNSEIPAPPPPPHCVGKLESLQLRYAGGGCAASQNTQAAGKVICTGNAGTTQPVRIVITSKKSATTVYADVSNVALGATITAKAGAGKTFDTDTLIKILSGTTAIETIQVHTSCSQPLNLGDHYGSLEVVGIDTTNGNAITTGADVDYTYKITNTGSTTVNNVTVMDDKLGTITGSPISSIAAGGMVTLTAKKFVSSTTTNTVTVSGTVGSGPQGCGASATATVTVKPPTTPVLPCTGGAIALTMQYTGPAINSATTVVVTGGSSTVTYNLASLTPGTILTSAAENGWTIDAKAHNQTKLGAQTTVKINGVTEILHTSCSCRDTPETNLAVCNAMCLDGGSPDNPTPGTKGPGSPLWRLIAVNDPGNGVSTCSNP